MGAYLSQPKTEKFSEDGTGNSVKFGASCMQGWRVSQEDSHNCLPDFDEKSSLFAVYDGHGGAEVAVFLSRHFPDFLKNLESYKRGEVKKSLSECFIKIDEFVKSDSGLREVQSLAQNGRCSADKDGKSINTDEEENVRELYEEATMPIEMLVAKYQAGLLSHLANSRLAGDDGQDKPCSSKALTSDGPGSSNSLLAKEPHSSQNILTKDGAVVEDVELKKLESTELGCKSSQSKDEGLSEANTPEVMSDNETTIKIDEPKEVNGSDTETKQNGISIHTEELKVENLDSLQSEDGREESILVEPPVKVRKGKTHPVPQLPLVPPANERKLKDKKIYKEFVNSESGSSDSDDIEDVPYIGADAEISGSDESEGSDGAIENSESSEVEDEEDDVDDDEDEEESDEDDLLADSQEPGFDSGSTAVVAFLKWQEGNKLLDLWVANAGDSRCTVSRGGKAMDMSQDHKPEDEGEARRIITAGGKVTMDGRVNGGLNLSRAIGDHSYKQNTSLPLEEQMITPLPDIQHTVVDPATDEFIVLACDGVWNSMSSQEVVDFVQEKLKSTSKISTICEQLFEACLATDTSGDGTGCDNMTAVIIKFGSEDVSAKRPSESQLPEDSKRVRIDEQLTQID